jgi:autotransporter-associated beta strand protein
VFNPGANAYTLAVSHGYIFNIGIVGITNNSGVVQHFASMPNAQGNADVLGFVGSATVGNQTEFNTVASTTLGGTSGIVSFVDTSSAGFGTYTNQGSNVSGVSGGETLFFFGSTADHGTFTNQPGSVSGAGGGETIFYSSSQGGSSTITSEGASVSGAEGGLAAFFNSSNAEGATLIAQTGTSGGSGGRIEFHESSGADTARLEVFGNGILDVSDRGRALTVGSLEGDGLVYLGNQSLSIGNNALNTIFSGVIQDGGISGETGGSLGKVGTGTLTMNGANTYTKGTTVTQGTLIVNNANGSATGRGPVRVNGGTLGGSGVIAGKVTIGTGSGSGGLSRAGSPNQ